MLGGESEYLSNGHLEKLADAAGSWRSDAGRSANQRAAESTTTVDASVPYPSTLLEPLSLFYLSAQLFQSFSPLLHPFLSLDSSRVDTLQSWRGLGEVSAERLGPSPLESSPSALES